MNAETIIRLLGLEPHPGEGGYYRETYRSTETIAAGALPARYGGARCHSTAIYYLLKPNQCSALHRVLSDEIFH
ncbi:MAG: cupin domain-containing protein [Pirellulaceae bacterium]|nr:cupin domain-containing protein [Pirellulaceae bacterium]